MKKVLTLFVAILALSILRAQSLYFPPINGNQWDTISPQSLNWCQDRIDNLYAYLDSNNTKAFIILKDGKRVLEKYFGTHTQASTWYWASAAKTLTAVMVGIAQQEGYLNISDTTSDYLSNWTDCIPIEEEKITIRHQLTMTSGFDDNLPDNTCTEPTCLVCIADPGTRWAYHNAPYSLLHNVIEATTGMTMNTYVNQKLNAPTGMTGLFFQIENDHVFFSNARSMARFGLLILNEGTWNGTPVLTDSAYYNQMVNTSQGLNKSYGYLWWLNGKASFMIPQSQFVFPGYLCPDAPEDMLAAMGKNGQFINVVPSQNLVLVRMGEAPNDLPVPFLMNNVIWEYINDLGCNTSSLDEDDNRRASVKLFPNPATDHIKLRADANVISVKFYTIYGQLIKSTMPTNTEAYLFVGDLAPGIYPIRVKLSDGRIVSKRLMVIGK